MRLTRTALVVLLALLATPSTVAHAGTPADAQPSWPLFGHDLANTRLNPRERVVTRKTVAKLAEQWSVKGLVGVSGTPVVVGTAAYFGDWKGVVHAVDAKTGDEDWTAALQGSILGSPAVDGDALFVTSGALLQRLDRATGEVEWRATTSDHPFGMAAASPVVADGLVFQGIASGELTIPKDDYTFQGSIGAYDAQTGEEVWRLQTTSNDDAGGAGVGIWSTPAIDSKRGLLYVGTGNNYEAPPSPLADSLVAIDYRTGKVKWSTQFTSPDVFSAGNPSGKDADVGAAPNLWRSRGRDFVGAGDKTGRYHALDRDTGKIVWQTRITPGSVFGGEIGSSALVDGKLVVPSNHGNPETNAPTNVTQVFALDPADGKVLWKSTKLEGLIFAPISAVPGVAFVGTTLGKLLALDVRNGKQLWTTDAPDKTGCGPAVVDGTVLWGFGFTLFRGPGDGGLVSFAVR
jgi:polyvinyl alcohol dehydrogenase (cytochrome)